MRKKIYFISSWLMFCLLAVVLITSSCTSCSSGQPLVDVPDTGVIDVGDAGLNVIEDAGIDSGSNKPPQETKKVVKGETWSISLPITSEVTLNPEKDIAFTSLTDDIVYLVIVLTQENPVASYDAFVISGLRGIKAAGTEIVKTETITSNGTKFTLVESEKDEVTILTWLTYNNNYGYGLSCAGATVDELVKEVCMETFSSFQLL